MSNGVNPPTASGRGASSQSTVDPIRAALSDFVTWSAELPVWQRDALRRLYAQGKLTPTDINELDTLCRQAHGLLEQGETSIAPEALQTGHVPSNLSTGGPVALKSLGQAQNVNALASDQTLYFSETGLTIIYGDNGSGKSGYGRVLKRACRARDQEQILPNAYSPAASGKPSALIKYSVGGMVQPEVIWEDGVAIHPNLSYISVFDSKCAPVHVDEENELAYTPVPLQLLRLVADVCREIGNRLKTKKAALESLLPNFRKQPASRQGTAVNQLILTLTASTKLATVHALGQLSEQERTRLEQLKRDLASDPGKEIRRLKALKQRIEALITTVTNSERILLPDTTAELRRLLMTAKEKAAVAQFAASEAFKKEPLPQAGTDVWKTLWEAAREFSTQQAYPAVPFPNTSAGAVCVLCQQPFSPDAADRLKTFEGFVQQKVQQAADDAKREVNDYKTRIRTSGAAVETLREAVLLLRDELDKPRICIEVIRCIAGARVRARRLAAVTDATQVVSQKAVASVTPSLVALIANTDQSISELEKTLDPEQRKKQEHELQELEDRAWLATILTDVETEITRLRTIATLNAAILDTDTDRITRKTTEVSRVLVTNTLRDAFAAEIAALGIADRRIELIQEHSGYGSSKFKVSLVRNPKAKAADVLSEGEHRCVAVAAFLAELSTEHHRSGLIFDDPVSSLDHNYRGAFAGRLVHEAATGRQVVIFTHDIPFLMMLDDEARAAGLAPSYQSVNRTEDLAGICVQGAPPKAQPVPEILDKVERRLSQTQALYSSGRIDEWCDHVKWMGGRLRDAWELATESIIAPVFRRYSYKVHTGGLRKLTVLTDQDCAELKTGWDFCCIDCHTRPSELNPPTVKPERIQEEIERLRRWFDSVRARQGQIP